jgi:hypothetical protein
MSFRIWRLGGTILPTRFMVKTYWAICGFGYVMDCGWPRLFWAAKSWSSVSDDVFSRVVREVPTLYFDGNGALEAYR